MLPFSQSFHKRYFDALSLLSRRCPFAYFVQTCFAVSKTRKHGQRHLRLPRPQGSTPTSIIEQLSSTTWLQRVRANKSKDSHVTMAE